MSKKKVSVTPSGKNTRFVFTGEDSAESSQKDALYFASYKNDKLVRDHLSPQPNRQTNIGIDNFLSQ